MTPVLLLFILLFHPNLQAREEHREHGAHQHGAGELSIAFDGVHGKVEFKSPSDGIVGFEHPAKSATDKKTRDEAFKKFAANIAEIVSFDRSLQCQFTQEKLEMTAESTKHSDAIVNFSVKCAKSPAGTKLTFNFQKFFPALKVIDAQILIDAVQKSAEIKGNDIGLELK